MKRSEVKYSEVKFYSSRADVKWSEGKSKSISTSTSTSKVKGNKSNSTK